MTNVDLSQLAIDRNENSTARLRAKRNLVTRYALPGLLILGFVSLVAWSARDMIFPPREVTVIPVLATQAEMRSEGTPLFNAAGWIEPRPTAIRVSALANGVVEKLLVVEDQPLKQGEAVATLVVDDAELAHQRAVADRKLAEAELDRAKAAFVAATKRFEQPVHLEAKLAEASAALAKVNTMLANLPFETERAESEVNFAERDYQRNVGAAKSLSEREIDQSKTNWDTAKALLQELTDRQASLVSEQKAITQRRDALKDLLDMLADEIEAKDRAHAQVKAHEARLQQMTVAEAEAKLRLDRMTIRAPVDGRVYRLVGLPGARVGDGVMTAMDGHDGGTVVTMYQPTSLQIRVDVRFEDIPMVRLSQPIQIDNPALKEPILGSVLFISSEADIQKNTLQVKVAIDAPPDFFKPEMLVDVTFLAPKTAHKHDSEMKKELQLYLPEKLILQGESGAFVWVADQSSGKAKRKNVTLGKAINGGLIEIKNGLDLSSRVIDGDTSGLNEGSRIQVTGEGT
jgi:multidrug efflux pump subunit AcrA (membrane-fusion protein)